MRALRILLFSCIVLFAHSSLWAQADFAPVGASWHHDMFYGSFHSYVQGDTMIQGITSTRIKQVALTKQPYFSAGLHVHDLPDRYVYATPDTVFVYNSLFGKFTPLYVFNAQEGDTVCLPMLPTEPGILIGSYPDSSFCFVVDSIRTRQYDTAHLRTVFTRMIGSPGNSYRMNYGPDTLGAYAEKIGSVYSGLLPNCFNCAWLTVDYLQGARELRCYSDNTTSIKLVTNGCDNDGIGTSARNIPARDKISIVPMPADNIIEIRGAENPSAVEMISMDGRKVLIGAAATGNKVSVSDIPSGIYVLKISFRDGSSYKQKLVIRH